MLATMSDRPAARRIAIIDDDEDWREELIEHVQQSGLIPVPLIGPYGTDLERLIQEAGSSADFILCDHNLSLRGLAQFKGAAVIEALYERKIPGALVTSYKDAQANELIRQRKSIPQIIEREQFSSIIIPTLYEKCLMEFENNPPPERRPHRTIIEVVMTEGDDLVIFLPAWDTRHAVKIPLSLIEDTRLRASIKSGDFLLASVNIGAKVSNELFYSNFEPAPQPDENDGLA